jgi:hypothetical protein
LAVSGAEANRKIIVGAVRIEGKVICSPLFLIEKLPKEVTVRLGKRAKIAVIT